MLITICWVYALLKLRFLRQVLNRQWTKYGISSSQRDSLEKKLIEINVKTLCLNKCSMKYLFIIHSKSIKYNFHRWKRGDPPLAASEVRQMLSWWRQIDKCMAIQYLSITYRGGYIQRLQCMPLKVIDISNEVLHSYTTESCLLIHFHNL